jgi:hypothetical protein
MARRRELVKTTKSLALNRRVAMVGRSLVVLLMLCLWARPGRAEPGAVQQIARGVYVWQGDRDKREPANCMWVIFKDYVVVVDANFPWAAKEILTKIKGTTDNVWSAARLQGGSLVEKTSLRKCIRPLCGDRFSWP